MRKLASILILAIFAGGAFIFSLRAQQFPTLNGGVSGYQSDNTAVDFARLKNNFTHNDSVKSVSGNEFEVSQPSVRAPTVRSAFKGQIPSEYEGAQLSGNSENPSGDNSQNLEPGASCSIERCVEWNSKLCVRNGVIHCEAVYASLAQEELETNCKPKCRRRCLKQKNFDFSPNSCQKNCLRRCLQNDDSYQKSVSLGRRCESKVQKNQELQQECFYEARYGCKEGTASCS
jgi:hypothetical protein